MIGLKQRILRIAPWLDPILEFFDWKKQVVATAFAAIMALWSYMQGLSWPVIVTIAFFILVHTLYLLLFPKFVALVNVGVRERPNFSVWKHKTHFELSQAACLMANIPPTLFSKMTPDARAWLEVLYDAVRFRQMNYTPSIFDDQHTFADGYHPYAETKVTKEELKRYLKAKGRSLGFLED
jgi:hypothetical protein